MIEPHFTSEDGQAKAWDVPGVGILWWHDFTDREKWHLALGHREDDEGLTVPINVDISAQDAARILGHLDRAVAAAQAAMRGSVEAPVMDQGDEDQGASVGKGAL